MILTDRNIILTYKKTVVAIIILLFVPACFISAQTTATQTVSPTITNSIAIIFSGTGTSTGSAVSIPFSTVSDYANGVTSATQALVVESNMSFNVTVNASSASFTYSGTTTPSPVLAVTSLKLMVTANGTGGSIAGTFGSSFTSLTSSAQNLITGGTSGSNQTFSIQYKATPGYGFPAGTYTTSIVFTATQF